MPNVIIYTTPTCQYCHAAKEFFKQHHVEYKEVDVSVDAHAAQEMIEKSGQMGVPVIEVNSEIIIGFDRVALKEALGIR